VHLTALNLIQALWILPKREIAKPEAVSNKVLHPQVLQADPLLLSSKI
jgi:hypothetical protein